MRKNRAADFFVPSVVAKPCNTDEWMAFGRVAFEIRVTLVIHVVQQPHSFPKIGIFAAQLRKMFHRIGNGVAMFSQAFGSDPVVKDRKSTRLNSVTDQSRMPSSA